MKENFKLYINGNEVEFSQDFSTTFIYQFEDLSNPSAIKNNYSKTIQIEGTPNNNKIFGGIYNLDRVQIYETNKISGVYFNASKRTPFELFYNNTLVESGYMQLNRINVINHNVNYEITLYGGLGDFFYNLMYNNEGEKRLLSDLHYKIEEDETNNLINKDDELNFVINKEFVQKCWEELGNEGNKLSNFITFAPSYNGEYNEFDNSTFLVNTYNNNTFNNDNSIVDNNVTYTTYNGYKIARTEKTFTEWEVRDLRSYMQRPALRFKKLLNVICDADNNGGYTVNLDNVFFNENNPYFEKSYMALPLLSNVIGNTEEQVLQSQISNEANTYLGAESYNSVWDWEASFNTTFSGDVNTTNNNVIDFGNYSNETTFDVNVQFSLTFNNEDYNAPNYYLSYYNNKRNFYKSIVVQLLIVDNDNPNEIKFYSDALNFSNTMQDGTFSVPSMWENNIPNWDYKNYNVINVNGSFVLQDDEYKFITTDNVDVFNLSINNIPRIENCTLKVRFIYGWKNLSTSYGNSVRNPASIIIGGCQFNMLNSSIATFNVPSDIIGSGKLITKKELLKTEFSPADVLIDYCKMFGLIFAKDIHTKTISIMTKNTFYNGGKVIDINNNVDVSNVAINTQLFENKYYLMKNETTDTYYSNKYNADYNITYGQKRIDTNYNFNNETKEVFENCIYQNVLTVNDTSPYFHTYYNKSNQIAPCWVLDNPTFELFNNVQTGNKQVYEKQYPHTAFINGVVTDYNVKSGYDIFPKCCFYSLNKDSKSVSDITATLLFFNGFQDCRDINNVTVPFWLSDDIEEMTVLNDKQMCYLATDSEFNTFGSKIAIKRTTLPQFIRYTTIGNNVVESLDFGVSRELYVPELNFSEGATLYNKYWKNYLEDRYNVNTRKIKCSVLFDKEIITQNMLKNFYYFNNAYWVMNKIETTYPNNYFANVEMVKVNDIENYKNAQYGYFTPSITFNENKATVDWYATQYTIEVTATNNWQIDLTEQGINAIPSSGGEGTFNVTLIMPMNEQTIQSTSPTTYNYKFISNNKTNTFELTRLPKN